MLQALYCCYYNIGVVHGDLKPSNILVHINSDKIKENSEEVYKSELSMRNYEGQLYYKITDIGFNLIVKSKILIFSSENLTQKRILKIQNS